MSRLPFAVGQKVFIIDGCVEPGVVESIDTTEKLVWVRADGYTYSYRPRDVYETKAAAETQRLTWDLVRAKDNERHCASEHRYATKRLTKATAARAKIEARLTKLRAS